jgi:nitrile hydratase
MSDHDHDHPHDHGPFQPDEDYTGELAALEQALRELLIEKGYFSENDLRAQIEDMEGRRPENGARFVARFWSDPGFRERALADGKAAATELGIDTSTSPKIVVLENTPRLHHMVVCTLCSCYPRAILGYPPSWYKSREYRSRTVNEPRQVLAEFGMSLPDDVEVKVVDSTADCRFLVVPVRPPGTEGMSEEQLAALVTRDAMIGVAAALAPDAG